VKEVSKTYKIHFEIYIKLRFSIVTLQDFMQTLHSSSCSQKLKHYTHSQLFQHAVLRQDLAV